MRILQVVHGFPPNQKAGVELYTYYLSKILAEKNEVSVFCRAQDFSLPFLTVTKDVVDSIQVTRVVNNVPYPDKFEMSYKNEGIDQVFKKFLVENRPDIIHFQHFIGLSTGMVLVAQSLGIKTVITLHDFWTLCPSVHLLTPRFTICNHDDGSRTCLADYYLAHPKSVAFISAHVPKIIGKIISDTTKRKIGYLIRDLSNRFIFWKQRFSNELDVRNQWMRHVTDSANKIICHRDFQKDILVRQCILDEQHVLTLAPGVSLPLGAKVVKVPSHNVRFGYFGNILPHKGVHILVQAFNALLDTNATLSIYGGSSLHPTYAKSVKEMISNSKITMHGAYNGDSIPHLLSEIDVVVVPSICLETGPFVLWEALALGIPVIVSDKAGMKETLQKHGGGMLFTFGDVKDLERCMREVINNPSLLEKFASEIKPFKTTKEHVAAISLLYDEVIRK